MTAPEFPGIDPATVVSITATIGECREVVDYIVRTKENSNFGRVYLKEYVTDRLKRGWVSYHELEEITGADLFTLRQIVYLIGREVTIEKKGSEGDSRIIIMRIREG